LAGYEVDLLPLQNGKIGSTKSSNLKLPVNIEVKTNLGPVGAEFEVRLFITKVSGQGNSSISGSGARGNSHGIGRGNSAFAGLGGSGVGTSATPTIEDLVVTVPLPADVRNLSEVKASRGDTTYNPGERHIDWHIPAREAVSGGATLRCSVVGLMSDVEEDFEGNGFKLDGNYDYDDDAYQAPEKITQLADSTDEQKDAKDARKLAQNKILMPTSANVSFSVKGWLASGIKVETLQIDTRKSRGVGDGVKPYKGVKYLTVSRGGVEIRC